MKKIISSVVVVALAALVVIVPAKNVNAATDGYVLTSQAEDLYSQAKRERDDAERDVDYARRRLNDLKDRGASSDKIDDAYKELDRCYSRLDRKKDKVNRAGYVLDFVRSRSESEIFLAGMQEKFRNEASLKPMQDRIQGAKDVVSAQTTQIQLIQQAIQSQTALAQVNPAIFAQVQELDATYQREVAQLQTQQQEVAHLQAQYDSFAATMPMPTASDKMKLAEIRSDFQHCCYEFDEACKE